MRRLVEEARIDPLRDEFDHYLIIRKPEKHERGFTKNIRDDVIAQELAYAGEAIRIYRDKDVVEKGFLRLKHSLGLGRRLLEFAVFH